MQKKRKKALERLSRMLPESWEKRKYGQRVKGGELPQELKKDSSVKIHNNNFYKLSGEKYFKIDHLRKLKVAYREGKEEGVMVYIDWLDKHNARLSQLFKDLEIERVDQGIMNILSKGPKAFWRNIIIFVYSFYKTFLKGKAA